MTHHDAATAHRAQFASDGLATATSARILTLCFDRLDRDLVHARAAIAQRDHFTTNENLGHAQDLLGELAAMLDLDVWEHAASLLAVYDYLLRLLQTANVNKSDELVAEAQHLLTEIGDAFRAAARAVPSQQTLPKASDRPDGAPESSPQWSVIA